MNFDKTQLYPKDLLEAKIIQKELAGRVILKDRLPPKVKVIAGVDISNTPFDPEKRVFGAISLLSYPSLTHLSSVTHESRQEFPYISGFLGFREIPILLHIYRKLPLRPDLILVDGHGICHPRKLGIASHLGVLLDIPTIGVAKSILIGKPKGVLKEEVGSKTFLEWKGENIAFYLRSKKRCLPLIVSPGHKIILDTAVKWVLRCQKGYRLPEPTRWAHLAANRRRKARIP